MLQTLKENTTTSQSASWEANSNLPIREISAFMEPEIASQCWQQSATDFYR
jgi:hypothetical protein